MLEKKEHFSEYFLQSHMDSADRIGGGIVRNWIEQKPLFFFLFIGSLALVVPVDCSAAAKGARLGTLRDTAVGKLKEAKAKADKCGVSPSQARNNCDLCASEINEQIKKLEEQGKSAVDKEKTAIDEGKKASEKIVKGTRPSAQGDVQNGTDVRAKGREAIEKRIAAQREMAKLGGECKASLQSACSSVPEAKSATDACTNLENEANEEAADQERKAKQLEDGGKDKGGGADKGDKGGGGDGKGGGGDDKKGDEKKDEGKGGGMPQMPEMPKKEPSQDAQPKPQSQIAEAPKNTGGGQPPGFPVNGVGFGSLGVASKAPEKMADNRGDPSPEGRRSNNSDTSRGPNGFIPATSKVEGGGGGGSGGGSGASTTAHGDKVPSGEREELKGIDIGGSSPRGGGGGGGAAPMYGVNAKGNEFDDLKDDGEGKGKKGLGDGLEAGAGDGNGKAAAAGIQGALDSFENDPGNVFKVLHEKIFTLVKKGSI